LRAKGRASSAYAPASTARLPCPTPGPFEGNFIGACGPFWLMESGRLFGAAESTRAPPRATIVLNPRRASTTSGGSVLALPAPSGMAKVVFRRYFISVLCTTADPSAFGARGWSLLALSLVTSPLSFGRVRLSHLPRLSHVPMWSSSTRMGLVIRLRAFSERDMGSFSAARRIFGLVSRCWARPSRCNGQRLPRFAWPSNTLSPVCVLSQITAMWSIPCSFSFAVASVLHPIRSFGSMYGHTVDASQWCGGLKPTAPRPSLLHEACLWLIGQVTRRRIPWPSPEFYPTPSDPEVQAIHTYRMSIAAAVQSHFLRTLTWVVLSREFVAAQAQRICVKGPTGLVYAKAHMQRAWSTRRSTIASQWHRWSQSHSVLQAGGLSGRSSCGLVIRLPQAKGYAHWKHCRPRPRFQRVLRLGHVPALEALGGTAWRCGRCSVPGGRLHRVPCPGRTSPILATVVLPRKRPIKSVPAVGNRLLSKFFRSACPIPVHLDVPVAPALPLGAPGPPAPGAGKGGAVG